MLQQSGIAKGAGHHSIGQGGSQDKWYIAYHRFRISNGNGYNRETCLSLLYHNPDGQVRPIDVFEPVTPVDGTGR